MGTTFTTGRRAAATRHANGPILYALFECTYESNVFPQTPHWSCMAAGGIEAAIKAVFEAASYCEGGMLQAPRGRITPEDYLDSWLAELAAPAPLAPYAVTLSGEGRHTRSITPANREQVAAVLAAHGLDDQAASLYAGGDAALVIPEHAGALAALAAETDVLPWQLVPASALPPGDAPRDPALGHAPATAPRVPEPTPRAMRVDGENRLLQEEDGTWRLAGWEYAIVGRHVREAWRAEMAAPGHHGARIGEHRRALATAPAIPPGTMVRVRRSPDEERHDRERIDHVARRLGRGGGDFTAAAEGDALLVLTGLPRQCAEWLPPT